ncbi:MAG: helix-turn-helix domain-containing protein [Pseudomonadota bacterium]
MTSEALDALTHTIDTSAPLKRGEALYRAGDRADAWYIVRSGVMKTLTVTPDGEEHVTGFHYAGEIIGLEGTATGGHEESAVALEAATACALTLESLPELWALGAGPAILSLIGERDRTLSLLRINMSQSRAEMRIAGYLKLLMDRTARQGYDPTCLAMPMSRTDLANHLGLTLECVSRVLSKWRKAGVLETGRNSMQIRQPDELATAAYHLAAA